MRMDFDDEDIIQEEGETELNERMREDPVKRKREKEEKEKESRKRRRQDEDALSYPSLCSSSFSSEIIDQRDSASSSDDSAKLEKKSHEKSRDTIKSARIAKEDSMTLQWR